MGVVHILSLTLTFRYQVLGMLYKRSLWTEEDSLNIPK